MDINRPFYIGGDYMGWWWLLAGIGIGSFLMVILMALLYGRRD